MVLLPSRFQPLSPWGFLCCQDPPPRGFRNAVCNTALRAPQRLPTHLQLAFYPRWDLGAKKGGGGERNGKLVGLGLAWARRWVGRAECLLLAAEAGRQAAGRQFMCHASLCYNEVTKPTHKVSRFGNPTGVWPGPEVEPLGPCQKLSDDPIRLVGPAASSVFEVFCSREHFERPLIIIMFVNWCCSSAGQSSPTTCQPKPSTKSCQNEMRPFQQAPSIHTLRGNLRRPGMPQRLYVSLPASKTNRRNAYQGPLPSRLQKLREPNPS